MVVVAVNLDLLGARARIGAAPVDAPRVLKPPVGPEPLGGPRLVGASDAERIGGAPNRGEVVLGGEEPVRRGQITTIDLFWVGNVKNKKIQKKTRSAALVRVGLR